MREFNQDEKELWEMIESLVPYDVMQIAMNQNGTELSVTVKNNRQIYKSFKVDRFDKE